MPVPQNLPALDDVILHLLRQTRELIDATLVDERLRLEKPGVLLSAAQYLDAAILLQMEREQAASGPPLEPSTAPRISGN